MSENNLLFWNCVLN